MNGVLNGLLFLSLRVLIPHFAFNYEPSATSMNRLTVYRASAGSGKTFTLAVEYVKLLVLYGGEKEFCHILAVTFTNKATTEMKDRILAHLYGVGGTSHVLPSSRDFFEALKEKLAEEPGFHASDEEIRRRCRLALHQILHDYSHFRVQTIDAFFQSILRSLAHELGLTANLQVEISDTEVLSAAVDRIIDRLQDEPEVQTWLLSLVQEQIENNHRWDVRREVKEFGRTIFDETYLRRGERLREVLTDKKRLHAFIRELEGRRDQAVAWLKAKGQGIAQTLQAAGIAYTDFSNGKTLESFIRKLMAGDMDVSAGTRIEGWAADPLGLVRKADCTTRPDLLEAADAVSTQLSDIIDGLSVRKYDYNSARLALRHIKPLRLLDFIDREVTDINTETSRFNLAKTPIFLNRMIGRDDAPFVFEKMGALLHHIMIDEFQDTSRLQWENFCVLLLDTFARGGRNLLVGDVKQSIYRWRGGDWRMLGYIDQEVEPAPRMLTLDTNFRSSTRVIDFNNRFFRKAADALDRVSEADETLLDIAPATIYDESDLDNPPLHGFFGQAYGALRQKAKPGRPVSGMVCVKVLDTKERFKKREEWEEYILDDLRFTIRRLHANGVPFGEMTILVRNNGDAQPIIEAFAADADMPPIVSDEAFLFSASKSIQLLIAALRTMDDPDDLVAHALLEEWQHELGKVSEENTTNDSDEETMHGALSLSELLERKYVDLELNRIEGEDAFLFGFFDAVADYLHDGQADVHTFLQYWDETLSSKSIPAGRTDGIRILTIHKAKGLEFKTVLLPFCAWDFERDRSDSFIWCSPSDEPYAQMGLLPIPAAGKSVRESVFAKDYTEEHLLARLDELNALYVAFTRARDNLVAWAPGSNLERDTRTVGDLIADVMPEMQMERTETEGVCQYVTGQLVVTVPEPEKQETEQDMDEADVNRMEPTYTQIDVKMVSRPAGHVFRQSNRSQQFVRQMRSEYTIDDDDEVILLEQSRQQEYIDTGLLLHRVFQEISTTADIDRVIRNFELQGLLSDATVSATTLRRRINRALTNSQVAGWFDGSLQLFSECGIASIDPDTRQPVTHRPDRVMLSPDHTQAIVVDFKFGGKHEGYDDQVQNYIHLLQQMYPQATIRGYLWYVLRGKVESIA